MNNVAMVNVQSLLNGKDSRWLQLEVCREFQRGKCSRQDQECKYAHPAQNVEVQNGRVTACYDSIKGRCTRENPPCKYFHPPQHLKDQLLINGRNHLALKNAILQQLGLQPGQPSLPTMPLVSGTLVAPPASTYLDTLPYHQISHPYLTGFTQLGGAAVYNPYLGGTAGMMPTIGAHDGLTTHTLPAVMPTHVMTPPAAQPPTHGHKLNRTDRLEVCREFQRGACKRGEGECRFAHPPPDCSSEDGSVTVCMDAVRGRCTRQPCRYFHPPTHLSAQLKAAQSRQAQAQAAATQQVVL